MLRKDFNITSREIYAFSVFALFVLYLLGELLPRRVDDLNATYGLVLTCLLFGVYIAKFFLCAPVENKIYLVWIAWMLITRWLNGDVYLFGDFALMLTCMRGFLFISAATVLDKKSCEVFIDVLSLVYAGFTVIIAILGIFVFITNTYIHIPPEDVWFTIRYDGALFAPNFLSTSRLRAAPRLLIALCLIAYQFAKRKNRLLRILLAVFSFILFTAISLCHSRTSQIAMMVCFALVAILLGEKLFKRNNQIVSFVGSAALAIVFALGSYYGSDAVCQLASNAHSTIAPSFEEYYGGLENKINEEYFGIGKSADELIDFDKEQKGLNNKIFEQPPESAVPLASNVEAFVSPLGMRNTQIQVKKLSAESAITAKDNRSILGNRTLSGRVPIWESGIVSIIRDPMIAVKGLLSKQVAPTFNSVKAEISADKRYQINMHNSFLEVLMVSGIPGLVLILAWTIVLVSKMVKLFLCKAADVAIKLLILPIVTLFIVSQMEVLLFGWLDISSMVFCLCVGAFLGFYYDIYPAKK